MIKPKAPSWFVRKLREMDSTLRVAWIGPGEWGIYQVVKYTKKMGRWGDIELAKIIERKNFITSYSSIGGRILSDIRRYDRKYFGRKTGYEEFCKEHNIAYL